MYNQQQLITRLISFPKPLALRLDKRCSLVGIKDSWFVRAAVVYALLELSDSDIRALIDKEYDLFRNVATEPLKTSES